MDELKSQIRALLPEMHFLDPQVVQDIGEMLDDFSDEELQSIYDLLQATREKGLDHLEKLLAEDPRFFEHAKLFLVKKQESTTKAADEAAVQDLESQLNSL